jgi:thiamine pyrophosphate-dependent acetolactate synthase large subunit-like protein
MTIHQRLKALVAELQSPRLLRNQGNGNEIGYYIFDYDAEHEPIVQQFLSELQQQLAVSQPPLNSIEIDLYRVILKILQDRNLLQKAFDLEANKGNTDLAKTIKPLVRPEKVVEKIREIVQGDEDLILITGVGTSWPMMRSHTILNNLHPVLDRIPVVMFFPGSYDGQELRLFDTLKDDNYYRAFSLIPRRSDKYEY